MRCNFFLDNIDLNAVMSQQQQQGQNMVNGKGAMDNKM